MTPTGPQVLVEVILISDCAGELRYRSVSEVLLDDRAPDDVAAALAALADPHGLLHSTSWRFDGGRVRLSYVALPDPDPQPASRPVTDGRVVASGDALEPDPGANLDEVAAHACRHLAFLAETDEAVAAAISDHPPMADRLRRLRPAVAGKAPRPVTSQASRF